MQNTISIIKNLFERCNVFILGFLNITSIAVCLITVKSENYNNPFQVLVLISFIYTFSFALFSKEPKPENIFYKENDSKIRYILSIILPVLIISSFFVNLAFIFVLGMELMIAPLFH